VGRWARRWGQSALKRLVLALSSSPFDKGRGDQPRLKLINATTVARGDEFPMNFVPFRALFLANFLELRHGEVRRIPIPRTPLHKGKKKAGLLHPAFCEIAYPSSLNRRRDRQGPTPFDRTRIKRGNGVYDEELPVTVRVGAVED
jgi:hypothetical protein